MNSVSDDSGWTRARVLSAVAMMWAVGLWSLGIAGCRDKNAAGTADGDTAARACEHSGRSLARVLTEGDHVPGDAAVGTSGDFVLQNDHATYVITEPDKGSTYYHYGGIVVDAVPMRGCEWAGEDKLDEVGLVLAEVDLVDLDASVLRAFRGERVEVLSDGSDGGAAVVRATGTDDYFWVVEYTLIASAIDAGGRSLSEAFGVDVVVDYILEPDSPVLRAEVTVVSTGDTERSLALGGLLSLGPSLDLHGYAPSSVAPFGLELGFGMPWLVATDGQGALAYAIEEGSLGVVSISGVTAAVDIQQVLASPITVAPGETDSRAVFLSVGPDAGVSATGPLAAANPGAVPDQPFVVEWVEGVVEDPAGMPVGGVRIAVEAQAPQADWGTLDEGVSGSDGRFRIPLLGFEDAWQYRLRALPVGRDAAAPSAVEEDNGLLRVQVGWPGALTHDVIGETGETDAARLHLTRAEDGRREDRWLVGEGRVPLAPGSWSWVATRGYEFGVQSGTVEVPASGDAHLDLQMIQLVDTSGFVSVDTHVHSSDSPDSRVLPADVLRKAAAHGLDLVVHTEHEHIVDRSNLARELGIDHLTRGIVGEEVTATLPEHLTMFPAEPVGPRGGPIEWYGRDIDELFGMMRERSDGGVNLLNHPSYLDRIGWDPLLAEPTVTDPTLFGLPPDGHLWSWNLDGIEVMNGHRSPFDNRRWRNWQSMVNAGHPMVAVGCSDSHDGDDIGFPRTYVPAGSDVAGEVTDDEVVAAFRSGQALASAGAFARVSIAPDVELGGLVSASDSVTLSVAIEALPEIDVEWFSVFVNCDEVMAVPTTHPDAVMKYDDLVEVEFEGDAAITIAAFGKDRLPLGLPQFSAERVPRVLTSPIYIDGDGDGVFSGGGGRDCIVLLSDPDEDR